MRASCCELLDISWGDSARQRQCFYGPLIATSFCPLHLPPKFGCWCPHSSCVSLIHLWSTVFVHRVFSFQSRTLHKTHIWGICCQTYNTYDRPNAQCPYDEVTTASTLTVLAQFKTSTSGTLSCQRIPSIRQRWCCWVLVIFLMCLL